MSVSKYDKEHVTLILDAVSNGLGRVNAAKIAGIHYDTFCEWFNKYPDFSEAIKKAELSGADHIKQKCIDRITEDKSWQSAAWWLERKYFNEFGNKQTVNTNQNYVIKIQNASEEIIKLLED